MEKLRACIVECQKGKKLIGRYFVLCGYLTFAAVTSPVFGLVRCFYGKEDVYMCAYTRVLISRACSNNICCDTAFFELVCLLHQSYLRCLDSLMILLQSAISERLGSWIMIWPSSYIFSWTARFCMWTSPNGSLWIVLCGTWKLYLYMFNKINCMSVEILQSFYFSQSYTLTYSLNHPL